MDKNNLVIETLKNIDLSPTMQKTADDRYHSIEKYFSENGLVCHLTPQGSFQHGTAIKPFSNGKNKEFDLDVIVILEEDKPEIIKNSVGDLLKKSGIYSEKLLEEDSICWTLAYAKDSNDVGFNLDLVPAVRDVHNVSFLKPYSQKLLKITYKENLNYCWKRSNSLDFGDWFLDISKNHISSEEKRIQRKDILENSYSIFASLDELPEHYYKTALQRAVQYTKRHRDMFYDKAKRTSSKPSSMIISSLIAESVKNEYFLSVVEILDIFLKRYKKKDLSIMEGDAIFNPIVSNECLNENYNNTDINFFEKWLKELEKVIILNDEYQIKRYLHNNIFYGTFPEIIPSDSHRINPIKPWRNYY